MRKTVTAVAFAAALAFTAGPALANSCPTIHKANLDLIAAAEKKGMDRTLTAAAKRLNEDGLKLHEAGKHAESMVLLTKSREIVSERGK